MIFILTVNALVFLRISISKKLKAAVANCSPIGGTTHT